MQVKIVLKMEENGRQLRSPENAAQPVVLSRRDIWIIFVYFALLALLLGLGGGLSSLPVGFFLKDQLKLRPQQVSVFNALVGVPGILGFLFGFLRDRWRPFGRGDRGYLMLTAPATGICYLMLAAAPLTYARLFWLLLLTGTVGALLGAAVGGLTASVAQRRLMTGRLAAVGAFVGVFPGVISAVGGGWLTEHVRPAVTFEICAAIMFTVGLLGLWRPPAVFSAEPEIRPLTNEPPLQAIQRLIRHRPLWPAALLNIFWVIMPGWGTPLFFYMTNTVKLTPQQVGTVQSSAPICAALVSILYGIICRRLPLRTLLWIGFSVAVVGTPSALLIKGYVSAIVIYAGAQALFSIGNYAISDLFMRSYPKGLEGAGSMLLGSIGGATVAASDILGSYLYERGGFGLAMLVSTLATLVTLPLILLVPRHLISTRDGEPNSDLLSGGAADIAAVAAAAA